MRKYILVVMAVLFFLPTLASAQPSPGATEVYQDVADDMNVNANLQVGDVDVGAGNKVPVDATQAGQWDITDITGTISLPTGAATAANQATIIGHVDGIEALLTTIDADTGAIATSVDNIDTDTTTIIGHVDGIEALLTTIDADTSAIAVSVASIDTDTTTIAGDTTSLDGKIASDDLDTGAGTDTAQVVGIGLAEDGGHVLVGSDNPMPVEFVPPPYAFTITCSQVAVPNTTSTSVLAANADRTKGWLENWSNGDVWLNFGAAASDEGYSKVVKKGGIFTIPETAQQIFAYQSSGSAIDLQVCEGE